MKIFLGIFCFLALMNCEPKKDHLKNSFQNAILANAVLLNPFDQTYIDRYAANTIKRFSLDYYTIAGSSSVGPSVNQTLKCTKGGLFSMVGTVAQEGQNISFILNFHFSECISAETSSNIKFTQYGSYLLSGNLIEGIEGTTEPLSLKWSSEGFQYSRAVEEKQFSEENCKVELYYNRNAGVYGSLCGRKI